jgi:hypothetical protein
MAKSFGQFRRDQNQVTLQTGTHFKTLDSAASPNASPLSLTTGTTTITIPSDAAEIVLSPSAAILISELSDMSSTFQIAASGVMAVGVAGMDVMYVKAVSTATLNFYFVQVKS